MRRRYKTAARIFLVLSVVNFMFAGFAQSRAIHEGRVDSVQATTNSEIQPASPERPTANQPPQAPNPPPEPANPDPDPDDGKFFSKEMDEKLRIYFVLASVESIIGVGTAEVAQHQIAGTVSPGAYVSATPLPLLPTL